MANKQWTIRPVPDVWQTFKTYSPCSPIIPYVSSVIYGLMYAPNLVHEIYDLYRTYGWRTQRISRVHQVYPMYHRRYMVKCVRSILDYGSIVSDAYMKQDVEKVQKQATRFITGDYRTREEGMLQSLELSSLENRRFSNRLIFMFKIVEGLVPAIPPSEFLKPVKEKRQVKVKRFENCETTNTLDRQT